MSKTIVFDKEAKEKLKSGVQKVADAVSVTMGPFGRNVLIQKEHGQVVSTKDGVTVAKIVELPDAIENMGATVIKQAAIKTVEKAGDGTTTSTVLASSIALNALDATLNSKVNTTLVKKGIESAVNEVIEKLQELATDIVDDKQIAQIATLSANGDVEIGTLVAEAIAAVGRDGLITVEESRIGETSLEIVEGLQFDRGYRSPYFVTDNTTMQTVLKDANILIYDGKLSVMKELLPSLEKISATGESVLIIAEDFSDEVLSLLVVNKMRGSLKVAAVKAPDFAERRTLILEDIAALTGGTVISKTKGMRLDALQTNWLGKARVVTVGRDTTTIVDGQGEKELIKARIEDVKTQIDNSSTPYEIEKLQERLAKMVGGVALINIGGVNEIDMKEKKDRLDDALQATKAAIEEGILPGCGIALLKARKSITFEKKMDKSFEIGKQIVFDACVEPFKTIVRNSGDNPESWLTIVLSKQKKNNLVPKIGSDKYELIDSLENGIIDPLKVVRLALENAAGAATTLLLTECVIHDNPEESKDNEIDPMAQYGM